MRKRDLFYVLKHLIVLEAGLRKPLSDCACGFIAGQKAFAVRCELPCCQYQIHAELDQKLNAVALEQTCTVLIWG